MRVVNCEKSAARFVLGSLRSGLFVLGFSAIPGIFILFLVIERLILGGDMSGWWKARWWFKSGSIHMRLDLVVLICLAGSGSSYFVLGCGSGS